MRPRTCDPGARSSTSVSDAQVYSGGLAVASGLEFVVDLLAFIEGAQASLLHGGDVNEGILAAVIRLDEAEAFLHVEKLNCSGCHGMSFDRGGAGHTQRNAQHKKRSSCQGIPNGYEVAI